MKVAIVGPAITGNKGASSMVESSIEILKSKYPGDIEVFLFSYYYKEDTANNYLAPNLKIIKATPLYLALVLNPLAFLYYLLPFARKLITRLNPGIKVLSEVDLVLDQGGITFADGRTKFLIFNVATVLPSIFMGKKIVKCAQALGPFDSTINRFWAKRILPKLTTIVARGEKTYQNLMSLNLTNVVRGADLAFSLEHKHSSLPSSLDAIVNKMSQRKTIGICPSVVVAKQNDNYVNVIVEFTKYLATEKGYQILLIPHSIRLNTDKTHNNDLPLTKEIYGKLPEDIKSNVLLVDKDLTAGQLRILIGKCYLFVASRFHSMVSSLSTTVPVLVIGWSHKYQEVLDMFELKKHAIDHKVLDLENLNVEFEKLEKNRDMIHSQISNNLTYVKKVSNQHLKYF